MAKQYTLTMLPDLQGWKPEVVESAVVAVPDANSIAIAYGDDVEEHRQLEIINGWKWLWQGIRERNLLNVQFVGAVLVTGAPINSLVIAGRRTASEIIAFNADDVLVSIGSGIASANNGASQMLDSGFRMLREFAKENP